MLITREIFWAATGVEPTDDDLDRCNCMFVGSPGHLMCGWNDEFHLPQFLCVTREQAEAAMKQRACKNA